MKYPARRSERAARFFDGMKGIHDSVELPEYDPFWKNRTPSHTVKPDSILNLKNPGPGRGFLAAAASALIILGGLLVFQRSGGASDIAPAGLSVGLMGDVSLVREGKTRTLLSGEALYSGDRISTDRRSYLDIVTADGHAIQVTPASSVVLENHGQSLLQILSGQVVYQARHDDDIAFVNGPDFSMETRGGSLVIDASANRSAILLFKGSVKFQSSNGEGSSVFTGPALVGYEEGTLLKRKPSAGLIGWMEARSQELASWIQPEEQDFFASVNRLSFSRNDRDLTKKFGRKPGTIYLKDGQTLRGVVASSVGEKLLIESVGGARLLRTQDIEQFDYDSLGGF